MYVFCVLCFLSPLFLLVLGKSLSLLGTTRKARILPFFQKCEILFSSVFLLFSSRCAFFSKETKKEENLSQEKILFCSLTLPSHEREKEEKIHHTTTKEEALSEALC